MPINIGFTNYPSCPKCSRSRPMVPLYQSRANGQEMLIWKCVQCERTISFAAKKKPI